jgi:hypothetical protein
MDMSYITLTESIQALYPSSISDVEAKEAASNLLGFMELLMEIDREHGITRASPCEAQS